MDASQSLDSDGNIVEYKYTITDQDGVITEVIQAEAILDRTILTGGVLTIALSVKDNLDLYSDVVTKSFEIDVLPPMPDEAENNSTIAGIDSDGDGVRDDVERYIASLPHTVEQKRGLKVYSKKLQISLAIADDKVASIQNTFDEISQTYCLRSMLADDEVNSLTADLKVEQYNTKARLLKWAKYDSNFSGKLVITDSDTTQYQKYCR